MRIPTGLAMALSIGALACGVPHPDARPSQAPVTTAVRGPEELTPAERAFLDGRLDRAVALLQTGRRDSADGLLLAYSLLLSGDEPAATRVLDETMRAPHYADEHRFRGLLAIVTGNLDLAVRELGPDAGPQRGFFSRVLQTEIFTLAQRFDAAQSEAEALARDFPAEALVSHTRGHLESARRNWTAAIDAYARSAELGGPNPDLDDGIAAARIALGQYPEARQAIDRCRAAFPDYPEILYQAIRLERARPGAVGKPLPALVAEYRKRTKRQDRLAEIAEWMKSA